MDWFVGLDGDATVNGLPGIEMLMPAGKEVKPVLIQERPQ